MTPLAVKDVTWCELESEKEHEVSEVNETKKVKKVNEVKGIKKSKKVTFYEKVKVVKYDTISPPQFIAIR